MPNPYYDHLTYPTTGASLSSSAMRSELDLIEQAFDLLPVLAGNGGEIIAVNSGATALEAITTTGTGSGVRATSPTLVTPVLGVATATSINKLTFTQPASGATLTIADGKTFTASNTLTLTGTDGATIAVGAGLAIASGKTLTSSNTLTLTATDGSTLAVGAGGTLGSAAYTASTAYIAAVTPGTSGNVLTSNGSAWTSAAPIAGGLTLISAQTASNSATIDFTGINSTYDKYVVEICNAIPATDAVQFWLRTSTDGGSTFASTVADYTDCIIYLISGGATSASSSNGAQINLNDSTNTIGSDTNETGVSLTVNINNPSKATRCDIYWSGMLINAAGALTMLNGAGRRVANADVDAIRFMFSSGNIESGEFKLYGLKKSV